MGASSTGRRGGDGGSKGARSSVRADPFPLRDSRLRKWEGVYSIDLLPVSLRPSRLWRCCLLLARSCRPLLARSAASRCCASGSSTPPSDDGSRRRPSRHDPATTPDHPMLADDASEQQRVPSALLWTAVGCTLASVTISLWSILRHLYSYQRPGLQRLVIRIMRASRPPSLSSPSCLSEAAYSHATAGTSSDDPHLCGRQSRLALVASGRFLHRRCPRRLRGASSCRSACPPPLRLHHRHSGRAACCQSFACWSDDDKAGHAAKTCC